ncbi:hypothetical protein [Amycolatopsis sp. H20-H5]|uniref:hypothetical protein n=1 Tax=Amycolatopsis sp. H20-H5 TaxID=3046309 RepID=UPI002DBCE025|nr:hypothetical protein [Amycolatopsis sp. H20-H5]MEC3976504.1 hypothetical protein [Amycolatopsis sp. H20-H5]
MNGVKLTRVLAATLGLPTAALAVTIGFRQAWSGRLPDPVATHWSGGPPNDSSALGTTVTVFLVIAAVVTLGSAALAVNSLRQGEPLPRSAVGLSTALSTVPSAVLLSVLQANLDAPTWQQATSGWIVVLYLGGTALLGALGGFAGGLRAPHADGPGNAAPSIGLEAGQRAFWSGHAVNSMLLRLFPATLVVAVGISAVVGSSARWPFLTLLVVIVALASTMTVKVRATVDSSGVTVRMGVLGWPNRHLELDDITEAKAAKLSALGDGGLGIRVNPLSGKTAYKVRGGPALVIGLVGGRSVLISVDHPEPGAGLINDLVRQHRSSPGTAT